MITVTADTDIYISGLHFGGRPLVFLDHARAAAFRLAVSPPLLEEFKEVFLRKFTWPEDVIADALAQLDPYCVLVHPTEALAIVLDDPDDDRILECAVAESATFIVSRNKHLRRLGWLRGIRILKVADFMQPLPTL